MEQVLIGFGGNMGHSLQICRDAVQRLAADPELRVLTVSSFYRTEPVPVSDQAWFINGVVLARTALGPKGLLTLLQQIEEGFGRTREIRWGPRTLDLDILLFGNLVLALPELQIPHPRLHERRFVLEPACEVAPDWVHPTLGHSMRELLRRLETCGAEQHLQRLDSP